MSKKQIYCYSILGSMLIIMLVGSSSIDGIRLWIPISSSNLRYYLVYMILGVLAISNIRGAKLDKISLILVLRALILVANTFLYLDQYPESWKVNVAAQCFMPVIFNISIHVKMNRSEITKFILNLARLLSTILAIQVLAQFLNSTVINGLGWNYVKSTVEVPLGKSNYLAAFLLIFMICIDYLMDAGIKKYVHFGLCVLGIFATMSDGTYALTVVYFIYKFIFWRRNKKQIKKERSKKDKQRAILSLVIFATVVVIVAFKFSDVILGAYKHFLKDTVNATSLEKLLNGRTDVYSNSIAIIKEHPVLGIGLATITTATTRSHNVLLQLLVSGGIINFVIFLAMYLWIMYRNFTRKGELLAQTIFTVMLFSLANSMYEVTYQSLAYDLIMFTLMGLSINKPSLRNGVCTSVSDE